MSESSRRSFLGLSSLGIAASVGTLQLPSSARPTEPSGGLGGYTPTALESVKVPAGQSTTAIVIEPPAVPAKFVATEDNILGPYFRKGAPFRGKVTPPMEAGEVLVVRGRVWGLDSRRPLAGAVVEVWQANAAGRYDNDDRNSPPQPGVFVNRARLITDESGYYEYETIKPGRYQIGPNAWRPAHIHYWVAASGYKPLVTQMYFHGDPMNAQDEFIRESLIIRPEAVRTAAGVYQVGVFDVILSKA